jgi:hypothetical protein
VSEEQDAPLYPPILSMTQSIYRPPNAGYVIPGYIITVDASAFVDIIHDALAELARTGRRLDFESLGQFMGVDPALLRRVVTIEAAS